MRSCRLRFATRITVSEMSADQASGAASASKIAARRERNLIGASLRGLTPSCRAQCLGRPRRTSPFGVGAKAVGFCLLARAALEALEVRRAVGRRVVARRAPDRFSQALDRLVQRAVPVALARDEALEARRDARRLVDRQLLLAGHGEAHGQ